LYLCVLIVFSLRRESLKLILATDPLPRWFCHMYATWVCVYVCESMRSYLVYYDLLPPKIVIYISVDWIAHMFL
jgi:hypothetical protein